MHQSMRNTHFGNEERVTHHAEVTGKKDQTTMVKSANMSYPSSWTTLQITHIKQFTNEAPKNQGEIHIGVSNNRKNNTVTP